ncbi:hypothetical protein PENTCL1PPCAC_21268, partial [Pristionchus entomophagus]
ETVCFGVLEGAEDDRHIHFTHRALVGSSREPSRLTKCVFDATSSGANEGSMGKMNKVDLFELCQRWSDLLEN